MASQNLDQWTLAQVADTVAALLPTVGRGAAYKPKQMPSPEKVTPRPSLAPALWLTERFETKIANAILDVLTLLVRKSKTAKRGIEKSVANLQAFKQQLLKSLPIGNNNLLNRNRTPIHPYAPFPALYTIH